jgi:hypothetical protein
MQQQTKINCYICNKEMRKGTEFYIPQESPDLTNLKPYCKDHYNERITNIFKEE